MSIAERLQHIKKDLARQCVARHKTAEAIRLIAVSKGQTLASMQQAIAAGQLSFGENYVQEAREKMRALSEHALEWHFIGRIQLNKIREIAENFSWVQSVCDRRVAEQLSARRSEQLPPLNICVQVNVDNDANKAGIELSELDDFLSDISNLPRLCIRGLMVVPELTSDQMQTQRSFALMQVTFQKLIAQGYAFDTLSMGMSNDYELAIASGSTMVRIGTVIFGPRIKKQDGEGNATS